MNSQKTLENRVILVTGASDGIGRVAAKTLAANGATVILLGRVVKKLEAVYDEIVAAGGPKPAIYPLNLTVAIPESFQIMHDLILKEFGRLDGLLHNAALLGALTPIEHYKGKQWFEVMQTNLNAPFMLTQALLPLLKAADNASIVFTTADVGQKARAYWGAYAVSKFGIEGFMQVLAEEMQGSTIRVNAIKPPPTATTLRRRAYPAVDVDSLAQPEDLMESYLYLMGPASLGVNGQLVDAHLCPNMA